MPDIYVVPHDVYEMMGQLDIPLKTLGDHDELVKVLSANDIADISIAQSEFPFTFSDELEIRVAKSPLLLLSLSDKYESIKQRVKDIVANKRLRSDNVEKTPVYVLYPVDEKIWVAVLQRQHTENADPGSHLLSTNHAFFDSMMANVLHTRPFEKVCNTNLFTYFLGSLTPDTV